jgi:hypothetical protein
MPILGVVASSISGNLFSASYDSIASFTAGAGGLASANFTSIPQTYQHLQIRMSQRSASANVNEFGIFIVNGVFESPFTQYSVHTLFGNGSTVTPQNAPDTSRITTPLMANASLGSNIFDSFIIDIFDYASTNKYKTFRILGGFDANGSGMVEYVSGMFKSNTNAITSLTFGNAYGVMAQYSQVSLYGIKGVA